MLFLHRKEIIREHMYFTRKNVSCLRNSSTVRIASLTSYKFTGRLIPQVMWLSTSFIRIERRSCESTHSLVFISAAQHLKCGTSVEKNNWDFNLHFLKLVATFTFWYLCVPPVVDYYWTILESNPRLKII